jgi:hypothetical protein
MVTLIGCGEKAKVEPIDTGEETGALSDLTDSTTTKGDSANDSASGAHGDSADDPHKGHSHPKETPERKTFDGNWLLGYAQLVPPQQEGQEPKAAERAVLLLSISDADGDSPSISVVAGRERLENVELHDLKITDGEITFRAEDPQAGAVFDYSGKLVQGLVIGSTMFPDSSVVISRLLPTDEKTFARIPVMIPLPESHIFVQLGTSPVPDEDTRAFVKMIPVSPLGRMGYLRLVNTTAGTKASVEELEKVLDEFADAMSDWGERAVTYSEFEAFGAVAMAGYDVNWCLAKADEIEAKLNASEALKPLAGQIVALRRQIKYRQATELLVSKEDADRAQGRELAEEFLKKTLFEPMLSSLLADDARLHDRPDEAIRRYAELATLPMQERMLQQYWSQEAVKKILPTERLETLWKEKHGSTEGLDEYRDEAYEKGLLKIIDEPIAPTAEDADKHIVLCELFTGSRCAPCVAADVGLEGIEKTYPQSQVITLRYHVHVPGHDPLTNDDCEARFYNYYKAAGTPSMFVDGAMLSGVAGVMPNAPQTYRGLRNVIDEFRGSSKPDEKTDPALDETAADSEKDVSKVDESKVDEKDDAKEAAETEEAVKTETPDSEETEKVASRLTIDLQVSRQQDTIQVSATVNGLTPESGNVRLMLALAESDIKFEAFNGIRHHDMVVRQLIGGDRGTSPKDGALSYQGTVKVDELRDRLHSYLTEYEENQSVEFASMPLDLANLSVVAFVQKVESRLVLSSVIAPVTGAAAGN